jgi:hypothetical protein
MLAHALLQRTRRTPWGEQTSQPYAKHVIRLNSNRHRWLMAMAASKRVVIRRKRLVATAYARYLTRICRTCVGIFPNVPRSAPRADSLICVLIPRTHSVQFSRNMIKLFWVLRSAARAAHHTTNVRWVGTGVTFIVVVILLYCNELMLAE